MQDAVNRARPGGMWAKRRFMLYLHKPAREMTKLAYTTPEVYVCFRAIRCGAVGCAVEVSLTASPWMIALYCQDEARLSAISRLHLAALDVLLCRDWRNYERAKAGASCSVILIDRLHTDPLFERLAARPGAAVHPTILVTDKEPENLRLIRGLTLEEVIWAEEVGHALVPAIRRASNAGYLHQVARAIGAAAHLPQRLRAALVHACRSSVPIQSVSDLAGEVKCDRSTLCRQWRSGRSAGTELRLEDFLDWLTILHAVGRRPPGRKWSAVAEELSMQERTLGRMSRRLLGSGLRGLDADGYAGVATRFEESALSRIAGRNVLS